MDVRGAQGLQGTCLHQDEVSPGAGGKEVLCIGDCAALGDGLAQIANAGWERVPASGTDSASKLLRENAQIRVALVGLDTGNAGAVAELVSSHNDLEWIALVDDSDLENVRIKQIISSMFFDYHRLPIDVGRLLVTLGHAHGMAELRVAGPEHASYSGYGETHYHDLVSVSEGMRSIYSKVDKVGPTNFPVLITGDSGTGKELVARAIHRNSERADRPLVVLNCGGVVPSLIQSELFGHEKGSFTSADRSRQGQFEAANGGTIFLDEIGELPLEIQANLLRVLEEKLIRRVGGSNSIATNVRVIAATNRNLPEAVAEGKFREDLLYRLAVVHIEIPPLCDRRNDIEVLANYYLRKLRLEMQSKPRGFSRSAIEAMVAHNWPGNVRELINRIKSAALLCENRLIQPQDLGLAPKEGESGNNDEVDHTSLKVAKENAERQALVQALQRVNFNVSLAARTLGVSRVTLYNLLKKHELR